MKAIPSLFFTCIMTLLLSGCVTPHIKKLDSMSDESICKLLGSKWGSSSEEKALMRMELRHRGVICDQGRIIAHKRNHYQPRSINTTTQRLALTTAPWKQQGKNSIRLKKASGVYKVPVRLNDAVIASLIIDSGAADMMLTPQVARILLRSGTLTEDNFLPGQVYRLADGTTKKHMRARLQSVTLGNRTFKDVTFSIAESDNSPMLLGQSLLERLGRYTIDYRNGVLLLE